MWDLVCIVFVPVTRIAIVWSTGHMIYWTIQILGNWFSRGDSSRTNIDWITGNFPTPYSRADEPTARVPNTARGKISLARGIHCCSKFLFLLHELLLYIVKIYIYIYIYIYTYLAAYRLCTSYRCYQIILRVKQFSANREGCEVVTGYLSFGHYHGGDLTLYKMFCSLIFKQELVVAPFTATLTSLWHSWRGIGSNIMY